MFDALVHAPADNALFAGVDPRSDPALAHRPRALGLHPAYVDDAWPEAVSILEERLTRERCAALGECGLDARVGMPGSALQIAALEAQLDLAAKLDLPVVLHVVRAIGRVLELVEARAPIRGFVHGYSGPAELVPRITGAGLHVSFGGLLFNPNARRCREAAAVVPLDRLLVETDAPDLDPARLPEVIEVLARLRTSTPEAIARATEANARALLPNRDPAAIPPVS